MNIGRNTGRLHGLLLCCLVTGGVLAGDGDTGVAPTPARQLGEALVAQGWDVRPVADGSQIYRRPEDAGEARAAAPAAPQETPSTTPAEQLRGALLDQGWHTRPGDDGSVFYLPPVSPPRAVETPSEQLREQLERQGWVGSTAADGSTLYRRPVTPAAPVPVPGVGSDSLAGRLRAELEGRGWDAAPAEDGGVYYFPTAQGRGAGVAGRRAAQAARSPGLGVQHRRSRQHPLPGPRRDGVARAAGLVGEPAAADTRAARLGRSPDRGWRRPLSAATLAGPNTAGAGRTTDQPAGAGFGA